MFVEKVEQQSGAYKRHTETPQRTVFLVDDNSDDLDLAMRTLRKTSEFCNIIPLKSGDALFDALTSQGVFREGIGQEDDHEAEFMIILDVHMPGDDGIKILQELRDNPLTADIPVLMLTEDTGTAAIEQTYTMRANGYFTKPLQETHINTILNIFEKGYGPDITRP